MRPSVYDLRAFNLPPFLIALAVVALFTVAALASVGTGRVLGGPGAVAVAQVLTGLLVVLVVVALAVVPRLARRRRLVIDHDGLRIERGERSDEFRLAWAELAAVGLVVDDRRRRSLQEQADPVRGWIAGANVALELVPVDEETRRRHPELAQAFVLGGRRAWRVLVTFGPGDVLPLDLALERWCPQLWSGVRHVPVFDLRGSRSDRS